MSHPTTLIESMQLYPTEDACRQAIALHRWPDGFLCPRCGHRRAWQLHHRALYECTGCHYQVSLTAGTIFQGSRTDLRTWFLAVWLLASTKKAPSSAELARQLGVTTKTAGLLRRKIIHAMARREGELMLYGTVELDEGFVGGESRGRESHGRRRPHKTMVAVAAEQLPDGRLGRAHMRVIADGSAESLGGAAQVTIGPASKVHTDGWKGYTGLAGADYVTSSAPCPPAPTSTPGCPGRTSSSPTSSAGRWMSSTGSPRPTCRPTWMSSATGSTGVPSDSTSFAAS